MTLNRPRTIPRALEFALFVTAMAWVGAASVVAGRAAQGIAGRLHLDAGESLLDRLFFIFLTVLGFRVLEWIATRGVHRGDLLRLPARPGWPTEFATGAAVGWGLCLAAVLPVLLTGHLHSRWNWQPGTLVAILISLATLAAIALGEEIVFRGYPFLRLTAALGKTPAALLLSLIFALVLVYANPPRHSGMAVLDGLLFGLVLTIAYLRTHALWMGWGLHFAYRAVAAVALGLPAAGHTEYATPFDTYTYGSHWLTGGSFGLDAAVLTACVMLGGMVWLYRATREYAWKYTHREIEAAGYEVQVAPPAAHVAMERAAAPPPLVQILPAAPPPPPPPRVEETTGAPPPPRF